MTGIAQRKHKCKVCAITYTKSMPMQKVCSAECAIAVVQIQKQKKIAKAERDERKETKRKINALRSKPKLTKLAQSAFNSYIRARDAGNTCISCDDPLLDTPNSYDAGHYRSVGSASHMRFVEDNCHGQCKHCNKYLAGNHVEYRKRLIGRIGIERLEAIESDQATSRHDKQSLIDLAASYREKAKELLKRK